MGDKVIVCGAGTMGSGRYLTGDFIEPHGKNEISHSMPHRRSECNKNGYYLLADRRAGLQVHTDWKTALLWICHEQGLCRRYGFVPGRTGRRKLSVSIKGEFSKRRFHRVVLLLWVKGALFGGN